MIKIILSLLKIAVVVYVLLCGLLYFFQEKLIFFPDKTDKNFKFNFNQPFEELSIKTEDNKLLNGILFKSDN